MYFSTFLLSPDESLANPKLRLLLSTHFYTFPVINLEEKGKENRRIYLFSFLLLMLGF